MPARVVLKMEVVKALLSYERRRGGKGRMKREGGRKGSSGQGCNESRSLTMVD